MKKLILIVVTAMIFSACQKDNNPPAMDQLTTQQKIIIPSEINASARNSDDQYNTFYGPTIQMGEGHVRSWVNISHDDKALAIGIEMTEGALMQHEHSTSADGHSNEFVMLLHQKAKELMPFDHIVINWNEAGHPPPGIYTVPHFDFHFYKMPLEERLAIPPYPQAMAAFNNNPLPGYLPPAYVKAPAGEARMGAHWMDVTSPEFNGQPFTHTFVYGSYDGKVNFLEPMATLAFLNAGTTVHKQIRQPQFFDPTNTYYPTRYNIWKNEDNDRHYIAMNQMQLK